MTRILIVDDHPIVRQGLSQLIEERLGAAKVGEAGSAAQAMDALRRESWDALLLDLNLPDKNGFDLLLDLRARYPRLPVLILSMHPEHSAAPRLLRAGARGYLNKESAADELVGALQRILAGGRYVSARLAEQLAEDIAEARVVAPHERLSEREFQVMRLLAEGQAVGDIAERLCLSGNTVRTYRARVLEKMGLSNNAELTRYALNHTLI